MIATILEAKPSAHSIDRASQRLLDAWKATRLEDEGLFTWLKRIGSLAMTAILAEKGHKDGLRGRGFVRGRWGGIDWRFNVQGKKGKIITVSSKRTKKELIRRLKDAIEEFNE